MNSFTLQNTEIMITDELMKRLASVSGLREAPFANGYSKDVDMDDEPFNQSLSLKRKDFDQDSDSFDDTASTCAPSSLGSSSCFSTPESGPKENPFADTEAFLALLPTNDDAKVCIIHHDEMQGHAPPRSTGIYELPRRVIAIENSLKGQATSTGMPKRNWGNTPMRFLRDPRDNLAQKATFCAYGSPAPKRRRASYVSAPVAAGSVWEACRIVEAPTVDVKDLLLVHSMRHIEEVTRLCGMAKKHDAAIFPLAKRFVGEQHGSYDNAPKNSKAFAKQGKLNDDIFYSPNSLAAMKRASGGAVEAVRQLFRIDPASGRSLGSSDTESTFAIVRPPGHHCCSNTPNGFCFFNNTAIAALHARKVLGLQRVAIVDWDYHHGDGQQKVFYSDPNVLTISMHVAIERSKKTGKEGIAFPGNKGMNINKNGRGKGVGYNINIPWPHDYVVAKDYEEAFQSIVMPALRGYKPDVILVACGFDAVKGDNLAGTLMTPSAYYDMTRQLLSLKKPMAVILEGGYAPSLLAQGSLNVVTALLGRPAPPRPKDEVIQRSPWAVPEASDGSTEPEVYRDLEVEGVLDAIRRRLNTLPPWNKMNCPGSDRFFHEESSPIAAAGELVGCRLTKLINQLACCP